MKLQITLCCSDIHAAADGIKEHHSLLLMNHEKNGCPAQSSFRPAALRGASNQMTAYVLHTCGPRNDELSGAMNLDLGELWPPALMSCAGTISQGHPARLCRDL